MGRRRVRSRWRWAKWGLGVGALAALVVWGVSVWWSAWVGTGPIPIFTSNGLGGGAGFTRGLVFGGVWWDTRPTRWAPEWDVQAARGEDFHWWIDWEIDRGVSGSAFVGAPLWLVGVVGGLGWGVMWWRARRGPAWACRRCGYDLRGITGGVCPECGGEGEATKGEKPERS